MTTSEDLSKNISMEPAQQKEQTLPSYEDSERPTRFSKKSNAIEAKTYDFRAARSYLVNPNSLGESIVHMLMFGLGAGVVAAHEAYYLCGVWTAISLNLCIAMINGYCVCTLVWSAQKLYGRVQMPTLTYPDIAEASVYLSPWPLFRKASRCIRYIVEGTLMLHLFGNCSVIVVMLSRSLKQLVEGTEKIMDEGSPPLRVYILSLMLPCAVVVMITDLKNLAPFALIADLYACTVSLLTMYYGCKFHTMDPFQLPGYTSPNGVFEFIGICVFTMESASIALPIENNMAEPKKFHYVMLGSTPTVTISMLMIGFFGFWVYGNKSKAPITLHFPFTPFPTTLKVFICLVLYVIYAVCFYVAFDIEWFYIKRYHQVSNYWFWERLYRTVHVILITFIAYALPDVTKVMGLVGCLATSPAIFIYPPIIELLVDWELPGLGYLKWRLIKAVAIVTFGLAVHLAGTYYSILNLLGILPRLSLSLENTRFGNASLVVLRDERTEFKNLTRL